MLGSNRKDIKICSRRDCGGSRGMKEIEKTFECRYEGEKERSCPLFQKMKEETAVKIK